MCRCTSRHLFSYGGLETGFKCITTPRDWPKKISRQFFIQSEVKQKPLSKPLTRVPFPALCVNYRHLPRALIGSLDCLCAFWLANLKTSPSRRFCCVFGQNVLKLWPGTFARALDFHKSPSSSVFIHDPSDDGRPLATSLLVRPLRGPKTWQLASLAKLCSTLKFMMSTCGKSTRARNDIRIPWQIYRVPITQLIIAVISRLQLPCETRDSFTEGRACRVGLIECY